MKRICIGISIFVMGLWVSSCSGTPSSFSITIGNPPSQGNQTKEGQSQPTPAQQKSDASSGGAQTSPMVQKDGTIVFNQGGSLPSGIQAPVEAYLQPDEVLVTYFNADRFESNYGIGKILTPASEKTKGEAEIQSFYNNNKYWVPGAWIITKSRPAVADELKPGMLVLCGKRDDYGRRNYDSWFLGVVKATDTLYKGEITLERYPHDAQLETFQWKVENIRIILEPQLKFKKMGNNYMKVK
ncbi:MAG: hypothetical protein N2Z76_01165 [Treponemataceae bacterium]|nr:hypothetical protein [Treponemataceae bacterium]